VDYECAVPLGGLVAITTGGSHACALAEDGRAYCWGDNHYGQRGDGGGPSGQCTAVEVCATDTGYCSGAMPLDDAAVRTCDDITVTPL
jgi:hypothetical protein